MRDVSILAMVPTAGGQGRAAGMGVGCQQMDDKNGCSIALQRACGWWHHGLCGMSMALCRLRGIIICCVAMCCFAETEYHLGALARGVQGPRAR